MTKTIRVNLSDEEIDLINDATELLNVIADELSQQDNGTECDTEINYDFKEIISALDFIKVELEL